MKPQTFNYNFRDQFAAKVEAGEKLQTMRLERRDKKRPKKGDRVQLFCGLRTKHCRKLAVGTVTACFSVVLELGEASAHALIVDDLRLSATASEHFAKQDGFDSAKDMREFFRKQYRGEPEFRGYCVRWRLDNANR